MQYRYDKPGVKNTSPESIRPFHHIDQLDLPEIVPGAVVTVHNTEEHDQKESYTVASHPYIDDHYGCLVVQVETYVPRTNTDWHSVAVKKLSDFGVVPNPDGTWNQTHYTLLNYHWVTRQVTLVPGEICSYLEYEFKLAPSNLPCERDCCLEYPIEYVDITNSLHHSMYTVKLTNWWQKVTAYLEVKKNDHASILVRHMK